MHSWGRMGCVSSSEGHFPIAASTSCLSAVGQRMVNVEIWAVSLLLLRSVSHPSHIQDMGLWISVVFILIMQNMLLDVPRIAWFKTEKYKHPSCLWVNYTIWKVFSGEKCWKTGSWKLGQDMKRVINTNTKVGNNGELVRKMSPATLVRISWKAVWKEPDDGKKWTTLVATTVWTDNQMGEVCAWRVLNFLASCEGDITQSLLSFSTLFPPHVTGRSFSALYIFLSIKTEQY